MLEVNTRGSPLAVAILALSMEKTGRTMLADKLVSRTSYAEIPPRVEYALTGHARALEPIVLALTEWARLLRSPGNQIRP